jgi:hypothetical protein
MKQLLILVFLCGTTVFSQNKKHFIKITFNDGPLQGTHIFYPEKGNYMSQANLELFEGASNVNASKLMTADGFQIHYINRHFLGEASVGTHDTKKFTSGCGSLNFIDGNNSQSYKKIDGDFTGCSPTTITKVSAWKNGIVKKRRTVSGHFEDTLRMKIHNDNGSEKTVETAVKVEFTVNESRRK